MLFDVPKTLLAAALAGSIPVASALAPAGGGGDAQQIARLRTEIDDLAADLETERMAARDELAALRAERAELERQVRAAQARKAALQQIQTKATTEAEELDAQTRRWNEPTRQAVAAARAYVERSLPFAREQRLAVLDRIERDLQTARPDHARAVERLWRFLEEEEAMGRELALSQHKMEVEGQPQIVDVVRLSMALLYFRTQDGRYGWIAPGTDGWVNEVLTDPALVEVVRRRFDAFDRNDALGPAELLLPATVTRGSESGMP